MNIGYETIVAERKLQFLERMMYTINDARGWGLSNHPNRARHMVAGSSMQYPGTMSLLSGEFQACDQVGSHAELLFGNGSPVTESNDGDPTKYLGPSFLLNIDVGEGTTGKQNVTPSHVNPVW